MFDQRLTIRAPRMGRRRFSTGCFATMTAVAALMIAQRPALAGPTGGTVVDGSAGISQSGSVTSINQSSSKAIINWQGFSIGAKETVNFNQPGSSSVTLNRVIGNETSVISGALNANGQVFIVNSAGVLFGKGAQVNVGGLVASTLDISNANFMAGNYVFSGNSSASIVNQGRIRAHGGGYVALLGKTVSNDGVISATLGTVAMASGNRITLNFGGNSLVDVTIDEGTLNALVENKRAIRADGGQVIMTAKAADSVLSAQVNNSGVIQARTMAALTGGTGRQRAAKTGSIKLFADGGTTNVSGKLDASAPKGGDGGFIETSGNKVKVADSAVITTKSATGKTGTWLVDPDGFTIAATGGDISGATLGAELAANNVTLASTMGSGTDGNINVNDAVSWSANTLTLNATKNIYVNAVMSATGMASFAANYGHVLDTNGNPTSTATAGGLNADGSPYGMYMAMGKTNGINDGTFAGRLDFSGAGTLSLNNQVYTVIQSFSQLISITTSDARASGVTTSSSHVGVATGFYALGSNLDATGFDTAASIASNRYAALPGLSGALEGLGHTVNNLAIKDPPISGSSAGYDGLVNTTNAGAIIRNIGMVNTTLTAGPSGHFSGSLVGWNAGGTIVNAFTTGATVTVGDQYVGGLVGLNIGGKIINSYATNVTVSGTQNVGGLTGDNTGRVDNSYATGSIVSSGPNAANIGGLVGVDSGSITNSHADVVLHVTGATGVGGLVGAANAGGSITNSYSNTDITVTDSDNVGGLVGSWGSTLAITGSSATGNVTVVANTRGGTNVGGLVGMNNGSIINSSYEKGTVTVTGAAAGVCLNDRCGIGGLAGSNAGGATISGSHASGGAVFAPDSVGVGGLVGVTNGGAIDHSYSTENVTGRSDVGGLVGRSTGIAFKTGHGESIDSSYASGNVTATDPVTGNAGGLVGLADNTSITGSHASGDVNGAANTGGLVGTLGLASTIRSSFSSGNVTTNSDTNAGALVGNNQTHNPNAISNSNGTGTVSTPASRAQAAADAAAKAAAARAAAAAKAAAARAAAAAQTAQAASRAANTVATNVANSAATAPAQSAAGTQATGSSASAKIGENVKTIEDSIKAEEQRAPRHVAAATTGRRSRAGGGGGAGLGASIRSIDVDGQRFDLQGGSKKDAPGQKP